jgi:hypothetical protein
VQIWLSLCLWSTTKITSCSYVENFRNTIHHIQMFDHRQNLKYPYNYVCSITSNP